MKKKKITEERLMDLADLFKMFGDSTRLRILVELSEGELSVGELAERLGMTQSAISHQLKTLRVGKLVKCRREGQSNLYSLDDEHVGTIIEMGYEHILEEG